MVPPELQEVIDRYHHEAFEAFITGDPEPQKRLWSRGDDATLANPLGPVARGFDEIVRVMERAAAHLRDGTPLPVEQISRYVTADLAYLMEIERCTMRVGDASEPAPSSLRVTTVFRREPDGWKLLHRHADPIVSPRPPETLING